MAASRPAPSRRLVAPALLTGLLLGLLVGLLLGWQVWPVRWHDTDPSDLRVEHQRVYVTMVADAYALTGDAQEAAARLYELTDADTSWEQVANLVLQTAAAYEQAGDAESAARVAALLDEAGMPSPAKAAFVVGPDPWSRRVVWSVCLILVFAVLSTTVVLARRMVAWRSMELQKQVVPQADEQDDTLPLMAYPDQGSPQSEAPPTDIEGLPSVGKADTVVHDEDGETLDDEELGVEAYELSFDDEEMDIGAEEPIPEGEDVDVRVDEFVPEVEEVIVLASDQVAGQLAGQIDEDGGDIDEGGMMDDESSAEPDEVVPLADEDEEALLEAPEAPLLSLEAESGAGALSTTMPALLGARDESLGPVDALEAEQDAVPEEGADAAGGQAVLPEMVGPPPDAFGVYEAEYHFGDVDFDCSFSIESDDGTFLGECGVGLAEAGYSDDMQRVEAFEVWLFDRSDIRTVSTLVVSEYLYENPVLRARLHAKGDIQLAETGLVVRLETLSLSVTATIRAYGYLPGGPEENSAFSHLNVEFVAERPQKAI